MKTRPLATLSVLFSWISSLTHSARLDGEPRWSIREHTSDALVVSRDERCLWVGSFDASIPRGISWGRATYERHETVVPIHTGRTCRANNLAGRAPDDTGWQASTATEAVRAGMCVLGLDPLVHKDGWTASGCP